MKNNTLTSPATVQSPQQTFPAYWISTEKKMMIRQVSPTELILVQVLGRDMTAPFSHRHERVVYPSPERLQEDLTGMEPSDVTIWDDIVCEFMAVNHCKREYVNTLRQARYNEMTLKFTKTETKP